jgi:hypothetical protein
VEEVNWRTTHIRTRAGNLVICPNSAISTSLITNLSRPARLSRFEVPVKLPSEVDAARAERLLEAAVDATLGTDNGPTPEKKPDVILVGMKDAGVDYLVRYWLDPAERSSDAVRHHVVKSILQHLHLAGIPIAEPVVLNRDSRKIALVAAIAVSRCVGVSRGMTSDTLQSSVPARQSEPCRVVIKRRGSPGGSRVASHTVMVKVIGRVVRICDSFKIALMAGVAGRGGICVSRSVARETLQSCVSASQRELSKIVIKCRRSPRCGTMTICAELIKIVCYVIRLGNCCEVTGVTAIAGLAGSDICLRVAGNTLKRRVCPDQHKSGCRVVPVCRFPIRGSVTGRTVIVKSCAAMIRIDGGSNIGLMARNASVRSIDITRRVARYTVSRSMRSGQCESSQAVIEITRFPRRCRVTRDAVVVKVILFVIRIGRAGEVATVAIKAQTRRTHVAGRVARNTRERSVSPCQCKTG